MHQQSGSRACSLELISLGRISDAAEEREALLSTCDAKADSCQSGGDGAEKRAAHISGGYVISNSCFLP